MREHARRARRRGDRAGVAHLAAALGVARRAVEEQLVAADGEHVRLGLVPAIAGELGRAVQQWRPLTHLVAGIARWRSAHYNIGEISESPFPPLTCHSRCPPGWPR